MAKASGGQGQKPTQKVLEPSNVLEEQFLNKTSFYMKDENLTIDDLRMVSAIRDFQEFEKQELIWPTKEVREERMVEHCIPGTDKIVKDKVTRIYRVPMTPEEAADHLEKRVVEMRKAAGLV